MKNSPHRMKHLRMKASRRLSQIDVKTAKIAERRARRSHKLSYMSLVHNGFRSFENHLKPINLEKSRNILEIFVKHWKREQVVHLKSYHRSKPTTTGEVEGEGPYTNIPHIGDKMMKKWESGNLEKSHNLARKIIKHQNKQQKKAA